MYVFATQLRLNQRLYRSRKRPVSDLELVWPTSATSPVPHPLLFLISTSPKVELNMKDRTETLEIGAPAPDFSLGSANREGTFTLGTLLAPGKLILEFLRGTW
jgi:hypothetical protein